jgi:hypothetical protein
MTKVNLGADTKATLQRALADPGLNAEIGKRAGLPQHEHWIQGLAELRTQLAYDQPVSGKAILGAHALHQTFSLGAIGLDYVKQGLPLPGMTPEQSAARVALHSLVDDVRKALADEHKQQTSFDLFGKLGRMFKTVSG